MQFIQIISTIFALSILVIIGWVWFFQDRMLYFPSRNLIASPEAINVYFEDVTIPLPSQDNLHAWYVPARADRGTILFSHGNAGNISHRLETLNILHELGFNVLLYDYRGYGQSTGKPSEANTYEDIQTAWHWLTKNKKETPARIIIFGRSLGTAPSIDLATKVTPAALIIESGFTSFVDMGKATYPFLPSFLARMSYNNLKKAPFINSPTLVIHSPEDEIVPYAMGKKLYEAAPQPKQFLQIYGSHNTGFLVSGALYLKGLNEFLTQEAKL